MTDHTDPPRFAKELLNVNVEEQMEGSYLDYAMSVIVGRALPDVCDGLKPVHRRIFHAMHQAGNDWNKPYKKSARIVGEVLGKYHPHGQDAVYDSIVRMAQDFSMRYMLVDGQGNFGSVDGDNPAAMRYTEVRLAKIAHQLMEDIDQDTVDFVPNYDGSETEPCVLPTRIPNLLINGSAGIAVGMATNIPPHNLKESIKACLAMLDDPGISVARLMRIIPGPDFPTGGTIHGVQGVADAYKGGRGKVVMRAKVHFEDLDKGGARKAIVVDELPYQVNKAMLIKNIAELVKARRLEGISELRDETDRKGIRVVIELRRGENADVMLNRLYKETRLQDSFGVNMLALVNGVPQRLNLRDLVSYFLEHRREIIIRRTRHQLAKARQRAHILEGFTVAVSNVDEIVRIIKASATPKDARDNLVRKAWQSASVLEMLKRLDDPSLVVPRDMEEVYGVPDIHFPKARYPGRQPKGAPRYWLSVAQAQAILELRLQRFTAMEQDKILADYAETVGRIVDLEDILANRERVSDIIRAELKEIDKSFSDARRTVIDAQAADIDDESLIPSQDMIVTLSHKGYVKAQPISHFNPQRRGGQGKRSGPRREDDFIGKVFTANSHDYLLCFTNRGRVHWIKVYQLPQAASSQSRGRPFVNLLSLAEHEEIQAVLPVKEFDDEHFALFATARGVVKRTPLTHFSRPRTGGIIAIALDEGDRLINVEQTSGSHDVMLFSDSGLVVRFNEDILRPISRGARGVRGIRLKEEERVVSMITSDDEKLQVLTATENGFGKKTPVEMHRKTNRGAKGVIAINTGKRNGKLIGAIGVLPDDGVMLLAQNGNLVRIDSNQVRETRARGAMGVRLIKLSDPENDRLSSIAKVVREVEEPPAEEE